MGELAVTRWRKYGKDRLYVNDEGTRVGWIDLVTGQTTLEMPERADAFQVAVTTFSLTLTNGDTAPLVQVEQARAVLAPIPTARQRATSEPVSGSLTVEPPQRVTEPTWVDLAANVPGQAARAQAKVELAKARDRGRVTTFLARALDAKTDERAYRVGSGGEESVGARLDKLTKHGWHVLHAVPVGNRGSDIDHVLVGPGGVYTLNTKTHPGGRIWVGRTSVRVNGHPVPYLRNSRHEAERAQRLLTDAVGFPVVVKAALVFLTGTLLPNVTIKQAPDDVAVLDRMDIPRAFRRSSRKLTDDQIEVVFEHARRSTTWMTTRRTS
jgi:hypothetical protein